MAYLVFITFFLYITLYFIQIVLFYIILNAEWPFNKSTKIKTKVVQTKILKWTYGVTKDYQSIIIDRRRTRSTCVRDAKSLGLYYTVQLLCSSWYRLGKIVIIVWLYSFRFGCTNNSGWEKGTQVNCLTTLAKYFLLSFKPVLGRFTTFQRFIVASNVPRYVP